jgi:hypothetical protein
MTKREKRYMEKKKRDNFFKQCRKLIRHEFELNYFTAKPRLIDSKLLAELN